MTTLEHYPAQIAEHAHAIRDAAACRALWRRVIEQALADLRYLERFESVDLLAKHERERVRRIEAEPPGEFIEGEWFEEICAHLGVDADIVRARVGMEGGFHETPDGELHDGAAERCGECAA